MTVEMFPEAEHEKEDRSSWHESDLKEPDSKDERNKLKGDLLVKVFCHRNSVLTDLMRVNHLQTVQNISIVLFFLLVINTVLFYMITPNTFWTDVHITMNVASKLSVFFRVWIGLNVTCVITYYVFKWWALQHRGQQKKNEILDRFLLLIYVIYLLLMFIVPAVCVVKFQVPVVTTFVLLCEQARLSMKIYSFVRENVPRVLKMISRQGEKVQLESLCPTFRHFLYYLFAPTLIYRDSYPRTSIIRWRFVIANVLQFFACIFVFYCILHRFNIEVFQNLGRVKFTPSYLALTIAGSIAVGALIMFLIFYTILHCWMNVFAEILRFGDRLFYEDWWNSTSFSRFYRAWNVIVHEWLHTYVYTELRKMGCKKITSTMMVFFISGFVHEFILSFSFGYVFPVLFFFHSTGVPLIYLTKQRKSRWWNVLLWLTLFFGWGIIVFASNAEWFARANSSTTFDFPLDYFIPRLLRCSILNLQ